MDKLIAAKETKVTRKTSLFNETKGSLLEGTPGTGQIPRAHRDERTNYREPFPCDKAPQSALLTDAT